MDTGVNPRLILNDDSSNFLTMQDDQTVENLRTYLARYAGTHVGMVCYCAAFGGGICYYDTEIGERFGSGYDISHRLGAHRVSRNMRRLRDGDSDYLGLVFRFLAELDLPAVASFRMNDCHMSSAPTGHCSGRFWMDHPEWRLGPSYGYYGACMNYAVPAVGQFVRALINEVVDRYPSIHGVELDFMRSPFFFMPGSGRDNAPVITALVDRIRDDLDTAASRLGRARYALCANVPRSPDFALDQGLDVQAWCHRGTIDMVSAGSYAADMLTPIHEWKQVLPESVHLCPYINCSPQTGSYLSRAQYRAAAANAYALGADGIYLFNFPCFDELNGLLARPVDEPLFPLPPFRDVCWHPDLGETREVLHELGDPAALDDKDKHYLFYMQDQIYPHYPPGPATIDRSQPTSAALPFRIADAPAGEPGAELRVKLASVTRNDAFEFCLNAQPLATDRITRLHAVRGRDARVHSVRLDPYSLYVLKPGPAALKAGENVLEIRSVALEPNLIGAITAAELEVLI